MKVRGLFLPRTYRLRPDEFQLVMGKHGRDAKQPIIMAYPQYSLQELVVAERCFHENLSLFQMSCIFFKLADFLLPVFPVNRQVSVKNKMLAVEAGFC